MALKEFKKIWNNTAEYDPKNGVKNRKYLI